MAAEYFGSQDVESDLKLKELVYQLLTGHKPNGVVPIEPKAISKRMSSQQEVLLAQTNIHLPFINNLCSMFRINSGPEVVSLEEFAEINQDIVNNIYH